jgi:hypothetical protein
MGFGLWEDSIWLIRFVYGGNRMQIEENLVDYWNEMIAIRLINSRKFTNWGVSETTLQTLKRIARFIIATIVSN